MVVLGCKTANCLTITNCVCKRGTRITGGIIIQHKYAQLCLKKSQVLSWTSKCFRIPYFQNYSHLLLCNSLQYFIHTHTIHGHIKASFYNCQGGLFGFSYLREAIIDKIRKKITIKCRPHTKPKPWKVIHSVRVLNPSHFYSKTKACRELKHTHTHPLSVSAVNFYMKT